MAKKADVVRIHGSDSEVYELLAGYRDENGIVHTEFQVREMTGVEEEAISRNEIKSNGGKVIRTLIERCCTRIGTYEQSALKEKEWRDIIQSLTVGDQDYIMLKIREVTIGKEIEVAHKCPNCKQELVTVLDIDELEINPFKGDWEIDFELPRGYVDKEGNVYTKGKLRFPNGYDREALDQVARNNIGLANTMLLTRCIVDFSGLKVHDSLVKSLSYKDRDYLLNLLKDNQFGVKLETEVTCVSCGESFVGNMNMANFL